MTRLKVNMNQKNRQAVYFVIIKVYIKVKLIQQAPRKIYLFKRADMDGLRDHLARFRDSLLSTNHSHLSVNYMCISFKSEVIAAIERFIPTKMAKTKYSLQGWDIYCPAC